MIRLPNPVKLCGIIFASIGSLFFVIGVIMSLNMEVIYLHGEGDVWILPIVFGGVGAICGALGFYLLWQVYHMDSHRKELIEQGRYIWAEAVGVVDDASVRVNGYCGQRLVAHWVDPITEQLYEFYSEITFSSLSRYHEGSPVKVYYFPGSDYQDYTVVLEE